MTRSTMKGLAAIPTLFFMLLLMMGGSAAATATRGDATTGDAAVEARALEDEATPTDEAGPTDEVAASDEVEDDGETGHQGRLVVTKTPSVDTVPATGADVTFTFEIENRSDLRFWVTSIEDDVFGTLAGDADCQVGTILPANGACTFTHDAWLEGASPGEHVNTVTVTAEHFGWVLRGSDTATVAFTQGQVGESLKVVKTADRSVVPATGADVTFTFDVRNLSAGVITITALDDDVFGALSGDADCEVGTSLDAGASCSFEHTAWIEGPASGAHVNTVTVMAELQGTLEVLTATDTEHVRFQSKDQVGLLSVTKTPDTDAVPETGADVTFTFEIENRTDLRMWIRSLEDDVFGTLAGDADCRVGTILPAGGFCSFELTAWIEGVAPGTHVNTVTVMVEHYGWFLTATDTAVVGFESVNDGDNDGDGNGPTDDVLGAGGGNGSGGATNRAAGATAFTGANVMPIVAIMLGLALLGSALLVGARRARSVR